MRGLRGTPLQKAPHGRIAFQPDGASVRLRGFVERAAAGQQLRARGPVRLVLGQARVAGQRIERRRPAAAPRVLASATARLTATTGEPVSTHSAS